MTLQVPLPLLCTDVAVHAPVSESKQKQGWLELPVMLLYTHLCQGASKSTAGFNHAKLYAIVFKCSKLYACCMEAASQSHVGVS